MPALTQSDSAQLAPTPSALAKLMIGLLAAIALGVVPGLGWQGSGSPPGFGGSFTSAALAQSSGPPAGTNPPPLAASLDEVRITLDRFGTGNRARPGAWIGVRVLLIDSAPRVRNVLVTIQGFDPDGDELLYQTQVATNPGVEQPLWLYTKLSPFMNAGEALIVRVYESLEGTEGGAPRPGQLLGQQAFTPAVLSSPHVDLIGVVGSAPGISEYGIPANPGSDYPPLMHELSEPVSISPVDIPDRWMGLAMFSVIVWSTAEPTALTTDQASAMREWVQRGGHLVVSLPTITQSWTSPSNPLYDLLPAVRIARRENVDTSGLAPLLRLSRDRTTGATSRQRESPPPLPARITMQTFSPQPDAAPGSASCVLATPDGACLVADRLVGAGKVTLVGLDFGIPTPGNEPLLHADAFWHRVLGRRGEILTPGEITARTNFLNQAFGRSRAAALDQDVGAEIAMTGSAATGVLLGFVLFTLYWLAAGPASFFLLKRAGRAHHAWAAYFLIGGVFTAVAWVGATLIRPSRVEARHVTLLDHIDGQPIQRARSFVSLLIPRYGDALVEVGEENGDPSGFNAPLNVLAPWEQQRLTGPSSAAFPDQRQYVVDSRQPSAMRVPTRATVKQLQLDWAGAPRWQMPIAVLPDGTVAPPDSPESRLRVVSSGGQRFLAGNLMHRLPAPLTDVCIFIVWRQRPITGRPTESPPFSYEFFRKVEDWQPGELLDFAEVTRRAGASGAGDGAGSSGADTSAFQRTTGNEDFFALLNLSGVSTFPGAGSPDPINVADRLIGLSVFEFLKPTDTSPRTFGSEQPIYRRSDGMGYSLGHWFTRPAVIVVGMLGSPGSPAESPVPLMVDGVPVPTRGRTVVRWIDPLDDSPPAWPVADGSNVSDEASRAGDASASQPRTGPGEGPR
ncbi:MAG: hypothetical protein SFZ23_05150 [Planctomycetota bacterium]|nr:hypothetical protein [Planctomycetota bacterium]